MWHHITLQLAIPPVGTIIQREEITIPTPAKKATPAPTKLITHDGSTT